MNKLHRWVNIYLVLSLTYMGVIFYLSSSRTPIRMTLFSSWDKLFHMVVYGVLASLIYLALKEMNVARVYALGLAFLVSFLYGVCNEVHQAFVPWRKADMFDVMANGMGALLFPLVLWLRTHYQDR
jgi:VanZ family protein